MRGLVLFFCFITMVFGVTLQNEQHFVGKINDMKLQDGVLYIGGEGGLLALNSDNTKKFMNHTLMDVSKIEFVNIDSDLQKEILISNWQSFALIDDDGTEISRIDSTSGLVSSPLPIDIFNSGTSLQVAYFVQGAYTGDVERISFCEYDSTNSWYAFPETWQFSLDEYTTIAQDGIKFRDGHLYTMQYSYDSNHIYEHDLSDGTITKDFNSTEGLSSFEVDISKNLLLVGTTDNNLSAYTLDTFQPLYQETLNSGTKIIKIYDNYIAVVTNDEAFLSTPTTNTVYVYKYENYTLSKQFSLHTEDDIVQAIEFKEQDGEPTLFFGAGSKLYQVDMNGEAIELVDLDNNISDNYYNKINAIVLENFGNSSQIIATQDIYSTTENNTSKLLYQNGERVTKAEFINIDADDAMEKWISDWYRTYVYDDDGTLLFTLAKSAKTVRITDIDKNGIDDFILLDTNGDLNAYNAAGDNIYELETEDMILNFDIKDIDSDGNQEISYITYSDYGDVIRVIDAVSLEVENEMSLYQTTTNISLFEYVYNYQTKLYSILVNVDASYRVDINGTMSMQYLGDNSFIDEYYKTAIVANMDNDSEVELIRATDTSVEVFDIFDLAVEDGFVSTAPIKTFSISLGDNELRGIALFDKELDGVNELVVAADNLLALYSFDGTKLWEYSEQIDTVNWEDNHFTYIRPLYDTNGNHKLYVSGYSLYEFDKNGNFIDKIKATSRYMVPSGGSYANPFDISLDGKILLGQMGVFEYLSELGTLPPEVALSLSQGWNLLALHVDTSRATQDAISATFPNASYMWKYKDNTWQFFSPNENLRALAQSNGYSIFSSLETGEGFWIYNDVDETITLSGNSYDVTQKSIFTNAAQPWTLLGNGAIAKNPQSIMDAKAQIKLIWSYTDDWSVYTDDTQMYSAIEGGDTPMIEFLPRGAGFWIYQEF